jgi:large subunit ribosomal protein L4
VADTKKSKENTVVFSKVITAILSNLRRSAAKTKKRGEVSGGGRKPWKQKGTGRARAGSNRSPIWRGGGVTFGPTGNQNYQKQINKKEKQAVLLQAFAEKKSVTVEISVPKITKTKEAAEILKKNKLTGNVLVLIGSLSGTKEADNFKSLKKVFGNIEGVTFLPKNIVNAYEVLKANGILVLSSEKKATAKKETK